MSTAVVAAAAVNAHTQILKHRTRLLTHIKVNSKCYIFMRNPSMVQYAAELKSLQEIRSKGPQVVF